MHHRLFVPETIGDSLAEPVDSGRYEEGSSNRCTDWQTEDRLKDHRQISEEQPDQVDQKRPEARNQEEAGESELYFVRRESRNHERGL